MAMTLVPLLVASAALLPALALASWTWLLMSALTDELSGDLGVAGAWFET
jgi:hypothetical protein